MLNREPLIKYTHKKSEERPKNNDATLKPKPNSDLVTSPEATPETLEQKQKNYEDTVESLQNDAIEKALVELRCSLDTLRNSYNNILNMLRSRYLIGAIANYEEKLIEYNDCSILLNKLFEKKSSRELRKKYIYEDLLKIRDLLQESEVNKKGDVSRERISFNNTLKVIWEGGDMTRLPENSNGEAVTVDFFSTEINSAYPSALNIYQNGEKRQEMRLKVMDAREKADKASDEMNQLTAEIRRLINEKLPLPKD